MLSTLPLYAPRRQAYFHRDKAVSRATLIEVAGAAS